MKNLQQYAKSLHRNINQDPETPMRDREISRGGVRDSKPQQKQHERLKKERPKKKLVSVRKYTVGQYIFALYI